MSEQRQFYTRLADGPRFIRDMNFPHQVARRLSREMGLPVAEFRPKTGKHRASPLPGLKPQQAELVQLADQCQAYILTRTQALAVSQWAIVFPQELPNEDLWQHVMAVLSAKQLLHKGE